LANLHPVRIPAQVTSRKEMPPTVAAEAPLFVREVTAMMMKGRGDDLPVSMLPADGTYPSGTTKWEKRNIADEVPVWEPDICIQCGNCSFVCPHSVIRAKFYHGARLAGAPVEFPSAPINAKGFPETRYSLQVYVEDCTGCNLCVEACPAISLTELGKKRSTCGRKRLSLSVKSKTSVSSSNCHSTIAPKLIFRWCAAHSFWSHCSNSPVPVPAAVKHLTYGCYHNYSVFALS
jgi:NAD-dependent dihydropyrimidine dehydrogenase PreA subunit